MTSYLKINANSSTPKEVVDLTGVPKDEILEELKKSMEHCGMGGSNEIFLSRSTYTLWCSDGKRYKVEVLYDDSGQPKGLVPNHRINAMVDLGRFTSKKFNYIGKSRNQDIKDTWGSNYFVGDVFVKVTAGRPIPDIEIFGSNPLRSILSQYCPEIMSPTPSPKMIRLHGLEKSKRMFDPTLSELGSGDYPVIPKTCRNVEFIALLKSWGFGVQSWLVRSKYIQSIN